MLAREMGSASPNIKKMRLGLGATTVVDPVLGMCGHRMLMVKEITEHRQAKNQ